MRVAVLGRTGILLKTVSVLLDAGHEVVLIGTCKAAPEYKAGEEDYKKKAMEIGCKYFCNSRINTPEILKILNSVQADIGISMNWLTIIGEEAINSFRYGILNAHCGDLPRYRGNACPNWAIVKGEKEFAITIHYMLAGELDAGNIVLKRKYPILEKTSISDIYKVIESEVPNLFLEALKCIQNGNAHGEEQSKVPSDSLRCYPRIPNDSFIDWCNKCEEILRVIRASTHPFQGAFCFYDNNKLYIHDATAKTYPAPCLVYPGQIISVNKNSGYVEIAAEDGIICISNVEIDGQTHRAADILSSSRIRLNYCLPHEVYTLKKEIEVLKKEIESIKAQLPE